MFKRIIAFLLVFVTFILCFCSSAFASYSVEGDFTSNPGFWDWLITGSDVIWDIIGVPNFLEGTENSCKVSDDKLHHASTAYPVTTSLTNPGNIEFRCNCKYCGAPFTVDIPNDEAIELMKKAYGKPLGHGMGGTSGGQTGGFGPPDTDDSEATGYVKKVQDELGTTVIGPSGLQIPLPATYARDYNGLSGCVPQDNSVYGDFFDIYCVVKDNYSHGINLYFNADLKAPVSGNYSCVIQFYSSCHSNEFDSWREDNYVSYFGPFQITWHNYSNYYLIDSNPQYFIQGQKFFSGNSSDFRIPFIGVEGALSHHFYGRAYYIVEPDNFNLNNYTASIGGVSSRPTSFTGDIGIIGDNGQLTKVEGDQIFNETTNNYYNPSTGTTSTVTDWFYDYSDRSYHLTMESGDTVTVTYGDENITIQEGDTTYNVYYIIEGSASTDSCPEGGAHDWQAGETVDATCTVTGFKTETCSKCGEERTTELPALGHKWKVKQSVQTKYDENGELLQQGYTIYECERCGEQYKSTDSSGPPGGMNPGTGSGGGTDSGGDDGDSIWDSIADFFKNIASSFASLPDWFSRFSEFLSSAFSYLPEEIVLLLTFGVFSVVAIGIWKAVRR